jgi:hypothetical protein
MQLKSRSLSCPLGPCPTGYTELIGHEEVHIHSNDKVEIRVGDKILRILSEKVPQGEDWQVTVDIGIIST